MNKKILIILGSTVFIILVILGIVYVIDGYKSINDNQIPRNSIQEGASVNDDDNSVNQIVGEDLIFIQDDFSVPTWITNDPNLPENGPWYSGLMLAESSDGLTFTNERLFLNHAGVAHLLLTSDNVIVATFQYFSYKNEELFDKIAYATSTDFGETWSEVNIVKFMGFDPGSKFCDPTLVQLQDGSFRLYFTYHQQGEEYPQLFSAKSDSIDGYFINEGVQLETDFIVLDPAVVWFDGMWHHYSVKHGQSFNESAENQHVNIHSVSTDGLNFEFAGEFNFDMQFLGDVIPFGNGIRFYGDSRRSAYSVDGYNWQYEINAGINGADPGVVELPNGEFLAVYTGGR